MRGTAVLDRPGAPAPAEGAPEHAYAPRAAALAASAASWPAIAPGHAGRTAASTAGLASGFAVADDDPVNNTDPSGDNCAGGPTTPIAVDDFAAAVEDFYEASLYAVGWYQSHQYGPVYNPQQVSQMGKPSDVITTCLLLFALICGPQKPGTTAIRGETPEQHRQPPGISVPAPPELLPPPEMTDGFSWSTVGDVLDTLGMLF